MGLLQRPVRRPPVTLFGDEDPRGPGAECEFVWLGTGAGPEQIAALATGVQYSLSYRGPCDAIDLGTPDRDRQPLLDGLLDGLTKWWSCTTGDDVRAQVRRLQAGMHAPSFALIHSLALAAVDDPLPSTDDASLPSRHQRFLSEVEHFHGLGPGHLVGSYKAWFQTLRLGLPALPERLPDEIAGWDLMRATFLTRAAVTVGWIEPQEGWDLLLRNLELTRAHYANWRQCAAAFVLGAAYWTSDSDIGEARGAAESRAATMALAAELPASPWRQVPLHPGTPLHRVDEHTSTAPVRGV